MEPDNNKSLAPLTDKELAELFGDTMGRPTSSLDTLTVYRAGKEDYFRRGDDKVPSVTGVLLYSQRPMRTFWESSEISDSPPDCHSIDSIRPSPESAKVQADTCASCPHDKFGSAAVGKGKACKTRAADFVLEVKSDGLLLAPITPTTWTVIPLTPEMVMGPALVRYGIGNREASDNYAALTRFAKDRGTPVQGLLCRWSFVKGKSKSNVEYDVVTVTPLAKVSPDTLMTLIVPLVRDLKNGGAASVLTALSGKKDEVEPGSNG